MHDKGHREIDDKVLEKREAQDSLDNFLEYGKQKINNLLWELLPPWTTMTEAERLACDIFDQIRNKHEAGDPEKK